MSPVSTNLLVTGLWAPSVLMPDWNQVQVSMSSTNGKLAAISRTMVWVVARATSCSGTPATTALTQVSAPRSQIRAPWRIRSCSSADLTVRIHMVAEPMSTSSTPGRAASRERN